MIAGPELQTGPITMSPTTAAGKPPMKTLGTPGPVTASPVAVKLVNVAAGKGISQIIFVKISNIAPKNKSNVAEKCYKMKLFKWEGEEEKKCFLRLYTKADKKKQHLVF